MTSESIALFPLGLVALPGEKVPLHIFEERYKTMISDCLRQEQEFGIVWLSDEALSDVGCACEVERVLEQFDDGRLNLVARGTRPFRILERHDHLAYPAATIEFLSDRQEEPDLALRAEAQRVYGELVERASDRAPEPAELAALDAYAMAGTVDFGPEAKQGLLSIRSENGRLRLVTRLLRAAMGRLDLVDRAQERAQSNGKIHFG